MNYELRKKTGEKKGGFALLYSVLVTSILITIGLSMADIATREIVLSSSGLGSQIAFYAADSGVECALYWDIKNPSGKSAFATSTASTISCNGQSIATNSQTVPTNPPQQSLVGGGGIANGTSIFYLDFTGGSTPLPYCAIVSISKTQNPDPLNGPRILTKIESRGYNTCVTSNPRRVERAIRVQY